MRLKSGKKYSSIRKVRSTLAWLIILFIQASHVYSQNIENIYVTETFKERPVSEIIDQFQSNYRIKVYYKTEWLSGKNYTGTFNTVPLQTAMNRILDETGLLYLTLNNIIYLIPREDVALLLKKMTNQNGDADLLKEYTVVGNPNESGKYKTVKITGTVRDGTTGVLLVGSKILVENTSWYSISGYTGNYVLEIPAGIYKLKVVSMGYEDNYIDIKAISPGTLNIELFEESHEINEVVVNSDRTNKNVTRDQMSILEMNAKAIKQLPSLIGEPDIIKSFASMPGVKSASEFGSGINVRGGSEDQNLFLLENCPIYNTSHVMGLLSVINPDAVSKVSLYKGHIPVEFGERVSSVMDIKIDDPTIEEFKAKGGIGIYSSRLLVETPLFDKLVKLKIGGRSSYSDYLLKKMPDYNLQHSSASFYDLTGSVFINLKNNPVTLFGYYSNDYFKYASDYSYKYGNKLYSLAWTHIFSPSFSVKMSGAYSNYNLTNENRQDELFQNIARSKIESNSGKINFEYLGLSDQVMNAGFSGVKYTIDPGNRKPLDYSQSEPFTAEQEKGHELSAFLGDNISFTPKFSVQVGLRYTLFNYLGAKTIYNYADDVPRLFINMTDSTTYDNGESIIKYNGLEPRISAKLLLGKDNSLKFSYNRNKQYISLLSFTSITTPEDTWKLADPYMKPVIADQLALGYYQNFLDNNLEASVEIYGKQLQNLTEYRNGANLNFNNHIETELLNAKGTNYGVEFSLKKNNGKLNGSLSYTYSRAWKQTSGKWLTDMINRNERYPSQYDIPHDLNINANYKLNRRVRFGATFTYASGRPVTLPEYTYNLGYSKLVYYSDRNKYRLPDYHRLDISMSIDESLKKKKNWKGSWTFSVLNVYGRKNAYSIFYQKDTPTPENNYQVFTLYKMYLIGIPMPTVTYNFIF